MRLVVSAEWDGSGLHPDLFPKLDADLFGFVKLIDREEPPRQLVVEIRRFIKTWKHPESSRLRNGETVVPPGWQRNYKRLPSVLFGNIDLDAQAAAQYEAVKAMILFERRPAWPEVGVAAVQSETEPD